ncbi:protoglobin domain-containing protein [Algoriphagus sp. A40]|uniref:protoglobin domain-containing protein n=1 Tax=Algoriphagus sp. A40 TaxID=1945863 RepID=UPI00098614E1|nr:protoglobin domain-containing protein [Algoriphagus sp. A40]OOG76718.1 protogloblin ApPgb [Algoriphagus sp. A40]
METIKGYDYGNQALEQSPVTLEQMDLLKKTLLWTPDDDEYLKLAGQVLQDQTGDILDLWYGYVGSHSHLLHYFAKEGQPDMNYLGAVRARFEKWVLDLCNRSYDQTWLNYQHEIAKRHHSTKKNVTDGANAVPIIHYRYLIAFIYPITATIRNFLCAKNHSQEEIDGMFAAWFKAVTLTVILWTHPYIREGEF